MRAVHFGAGNIGRGFIGFVLHENGFKVNFVDTNDQLIEQLNKTHSYKIELLDEEKTQLTVENVSAINSVENPQKVMSLVLDADIVTTSVGVGNLPKIAPILKDSLLERCKAHKPINILANENVINASSILKKAIYQLLSPEQEEMFNEYCYFINTAIDRQSLSKEERGEQIALVEPYYEWVIDKTAFAPSTKYHLKDVQLVDDLTPYIERKLFIVNASHAAYAYLGKYFGYRVVQNAIKDNDIHQVVTQFINENKQYFVHKYNMDADKLDQFIAKTAKRQSNVRLKDDVNRVGRDPIRKLASNDRLVGPVLKLEKLGLTNKFGCFVIAAAYLFENASDSEAIKLQKAIRDDGFPSVAMKISGLSKNILSGVQRNYEQLKQDKNMALEEVIK